MMSTIRTYWRDGVAGFIALLVMTVVISEQHGSAPVAVDLDAQPQAPFKAGVLVENSTAQDALARAGDEDDAGSAEADEKLVDESPTPSRTTDRDSDGEERADPDQTLKNEQSGPGVAQIEPERKPLDVLSRREMRKYVERYREWVHAGDIGLSLDSQRVSPAQLATVVDFYVLSSSDGMTYTVSSDGSHEEFVSLPDGKLIGDLSDRLDWPALLVEKANYLYGPNNDATGNFALSNRCEMQIYRLVADCSPSQGARIALRLVASELGEVSVVLAQKWGAQEWSP